MKMYAKLQRRLAEEEKNEAVKMQKKSSKTKTGLGDWLREKDCPVETEILSGVIHKLLVWRAPRCCIAFCGAKNFNLGLCLSWKIH